MFKIDIEDTSQWRRSGVFIVNFEHISHVVHKIDNNLQVKKIVQYPMAVISNDTFSNFGKLLLMYVNKIFVYHHFFWHTVSMASGIS